MDIPCLSPYPSFTKLTKTASLNEKLTLSNLVKVVFGFGKASHFCLFLLIFTATRMKMREHFTTLIDTVYTASLVLVSGICPLRSDQKFLKEVVS